jgi:hypothetical protein
MHSLFYGFEDAYDVSYKPYQEMVRIRYRKDWNISCKTSMLFEQSWNRRMPSRTVKSPADLKDKLKGLNKARTGKSGTNGTNHSSSKKMLCC